MSNVVDDALVSQFLAFTGSADTDRAQSYLEMSGGNLETAVGLFMEHTTAGTNGASGNDEAAAAGVAAPSPQIRAPDQVRTMRLMDHEPAAGIPVAAHHNPLMGALMQANDEDLMENNMASAFSRAVDPRAAVNAAAMAQDDDGDDDFIMPAVENSETLGDMFAAPTHLMHRGGGFQGARSVAKDARRWLLVNIQKDSEFSSHALNRDVWRDDLVENLVREGFIFYQTMDTSSEGRTYAERYQVMEFPHISIIDPRTGRLMWRKEGWTQENPLTKHDFAEMAMDFCSRHSFDKPPSVSHKRKADSTTTESEELQAALKASMSGSDDDDVEYVGSSPPPAAQEEEEEEKEPTFVETLLEMEVGEEPETGARIQFRMPDAKKLVRKFAPEDTVKSMYAFVANSNEEAKGGKEFTLSAGYPPKDLLESIDSTVESCGLSGEAITVRWK